MNRQKKIHNPNQKNRKYRRIIKILINRGEYEKAENQSNQSRKEIKYG